MRIFSSFGVAATAVALALSIPAFAEDAQSDDTLSAQTVIASVNGTEIKLGHVVSSWKSLPPQFQGLPDEQLFEGILTQLVQQEVLKQASGDVAAQFQYELENQERILIAGAAIEKIEAQALTDEMLQKAYDEKFAEFEPSREFNAAHILVATQEEAAALVTELEAGADFAELAKEKSTGPSGPNGGDLGWFGTGMMVPPFETAVVEMEAGEVSAPVQTRFGWHVILLKESRLSDVPSLDEIRPELELELTDKALRDEVASLEAGAEIEVIDGFDPAIVRNTDLLAAQ